jgi:hypothetical protein
MHQLLHGSRWLACPLSTCFDFMPLLSRPVPSRQGEGVAGMGRGGLAQPIGSRGKF